jgi:hypothetical protein
MTEAQKAKTALLALAATVSGCTVRSSDRNTAFPRNRWIPYSLKCLILNTLGCPAQAGLDLLGGRPDLQDLFLDPESESGGSESLPHPHSALGRLITMAALMIARTALLGGAESGAGIAAGDFRVEERDRKGVLESLQVARKLSDVAGRDDIVCAILIFVSQIDTDEKASCTEMIKTVLSTVRTDGDCPDPVLAMAIMGHLEGNECATKYFKSLVLPPSVPSSAHSTEEKEKEVQRWIKKLHCSRFLRDKIVVRTLGGSGRRTFLLTAKNGAKNSPRPVTTATASTGVCHTAKLNSLHCENECPTFIDPCPHSTPSHTHSLTSFSLPLRPTTLLLSPHFHSPSTPFFHTRSLPPVSVYGYDDMVAIEGEQRAAQRAKTIENR